MASYGYTFTSGDTVTPTKLNNARTVSNIVNADIKSDAAIAATKLASDSITNTQIKSDAAIAGTKISPNFGSQNVVTTGRCILGASAQDLSGVRLTLQEVVAGRCVELLSADGNQGGTIGTTNEAGAANGMSISASRGAGKIVLSVNNAERMRIDSSGRLLVGTSSTPPAVETIVPQFVSSSGSAVTGAQDVAIYNYQNAGGSGRQRVGPKLFLGSSRSGTNGSLGGIVASGDQVGNIRFAGDDGSAFLTAAEITAEVDGTPGTNDMPGRLVFSTTADGGSSPTERMRITAGGEVGIGTSSPNSRAVLDLTSTTKGFLPPRMTTAQRDAISTPPAGLVIYNTSTNVLNFYNGSAWGAV